MDLVSKSGHYSQSDVVWSSLLDMWRSYDAVQIWKASAEK